MTTTTEMIKTLDEALEEAAKPPTKCYECDDPLDGFARCEDCSEPPKCHECNDQLDRWDNNICERCNKPCEEPHFGTTPIADFVEQMHHIAALRPDWGLDRIGQQLLADFKPAKKDGE